MSTSEFDVIEKYFTPADYPSNVIKGIGDDCAVLSPTTNKSLVVTTDTLIEGVHFPIDTTAADIAYKAINVNLSDLASMGATPKWITLSLTVPEIKHQWMQEFSDSLKKVIERHDVHLVGGDMTRGKLSITIQAMGEVDRGRTMLRSNAKPGDDIYVSGYLGDAAYGLQQSGKNIAVDDDSNYFMTKINRPSARVDLGVQLAKYCSCAIDISDGIFSDINHVLKSSKCGADIFLDKLPISDRLKELCERQKIDFLSLMTGDDYELCFTVSPDRRHDIETIGETLDIPLTIVGKVTQSTEINFISEGKARDIEFLGYDHFHDAE